MNTLSSLLNWIGQTIGANPNTLATASKTIVGAINEVKANAVPASSLTETGEANKVPKITSENLLKVQKLSIDNSEVKDFVITQGQKQVTSEGTGYWRWREWKSGKVEMWYAGTITLNTTASASGGVNRYVRRITFPNNYALSKCTCIVDGTYSGGWLNCGGTFNSSSQHIEPYTVIEIMAYKINSLPEANQPNVNIYICGEKSA
jgi:hypothetical protein